MDRYEVQARLSKELGGYIHLNTGEKDEFYTEEDYKEIKEFIISLDEKYKDVKK
ncbi:hypothetical protein [Enterococcus sp. DIV0240a]|uniref:hypothetical protein n=1 Tax=unclassified Enterococcus TaxID=2608891 RepID=UPI003D2D0715